MITAGESQIAVVPRDESPDSSGKPSAISLTSVRLFSTYPGDFAALLQETFAKQTCISLIQGTVRLSQVWACVRKRWLS